MQTSFLLLWMVFMHIIDDFVLQNVLAKFKQKKFWLSHPDYKEIYKHDWIIALLAHAFEWTFMVMIPIAFWKYYFYVDIKFLIVFIINLIIHAIIDHFKANKMSINLVIDQCLHLWQIFATYIIFIKIF